MNDLELPLEYQAKRDEDLGQFGIGVIGAGFIVRDCHLVAYRDAGFHVVGIASRRAARAAQVAAQHGIARAYESYEQLLDDPEVEVVDIAVPPDRQLGIVRHVVGHNDHVRGVLAQKPLAMSSADAREMVRLCEEAGIVLAVNQNMRYDQSVRALKCLLDRGSLGTPVLGTVEMRAIPHWMPWAEELHSLSTFLMSIHHLDTFRYWFGEPQRVLASTRPDPRSEFAHTDGINLYILEYENDCRAAAWDDVWAGPVREGAAGDLTIRWRVEGTEGLARGTIGWPAYPAREPSTLDYSTRRGSGEWVQPRWPEVWFPDAFAGTMGELLMALKHCREPAVSGRDNLKSIALVEAVLQSATEHRVISLPQ